MPRQANEVRGAGHAPYQGDDRHVRSSVARLGATGRSMNKRWSQWPRWLAQLLLARAVDDPKLSDALLKAALRHLAPRRCVSAWVSCRHFFGKKYDKHHTCGYFRNNQRKAVT
jgi:hypothetical protein